VIQGLRGGYRSLARDVNLARDAIIAVPGEVMESQSASGAAKAVLRRAPTIIFRPVMGVSKAIGQTLMGATNSIDPHNQRRIDEVSLVIMLCSLCGKRMVWLTVS
jgi:autophagy-related protein 2